MSEEPWKKEFRGPRPLSQLLATRNTPSERLGSFFCSGNGDRRATRYEQAIIPSTDLRHDDTRETAGTRAEGKAAENGSVPAFAPPDCRSRFGRCQNQARFSKEHEGCQDQGLKNFPSAQVCSERLGNSSPYSAASAPSIPRADNCAGKGGDGRGRTSLMRSDMEIRHSGRTLFSFSSLSAAEFQALIAVQLSESDDEAQMLGWDMVEDVGSWNTRRTTPYLICGSPNCCNPAELGREGLPATIHQLKPLPFT